ncbi:MAG: hypothetical protein LIP03_04770 [Bacteroidales bacterium]|nr:hypothetical protein [Bacteroidales bacterium]
MAHRDHACEINSLEARSRRQISTDAIRMVCDICQRACALWNGLPSYVCVPSVQSV